LQANDLANPDGYYILYAAVSTVLAGAVWGDHCSPISDTTIISSMASGCDHIDHVRTQLPYALFTGAIALFIGLLPTGFGMPWWLMMPLGIALAIGGLFVFGKKVEERAAEKREASPETVSSR
jgi:Na+/H+ antiporter NhaC